MKNLNQQISKRRFFKKFSSFGLGVCTYQLFGTTTFSLLAKENSMKERNQKKISTTGLVSDSRYLDHKLTYKHPESPERLRAIHNQFKKSGLEKLLTPITPKVNPLPYIRLIHSDTHIKKASAQANDDAICQLAVSGALAAVDAVCQNNVRNAFCAIRPPGHHAANNGEFGFCFYNNIAIAARYAQKKYQFKKILIVDWDYHHGDGTEWAFYDDPSVLVFSTHALYAFPRSGDPDRKGKGKGVGFNINVALDSGAGDKAVIKAFEQILLPAAEKFEPDLILISAGFDGRHDDPLGDFNFTDAGFIKLTEIVMKIANKHSHSRIVSILEGGYNVKGLALATEAHVRTLTKHHIE